MKTKHNFMKSIGLLSLLSISSVYAQTAEATQHEYSAVPLTLTDSKAHYLLDIMVDGKSTKAVLDTGAGTAFIFDVEHTKKLGKKLTPFSKAIVAGGEVKTYKADFSNIQVGTKSLVKNFKATVVPLSNLDFKVNGVKQPVQALVGSPFLDAVNGIFDYEHNRVIVPPIGIPANTYTNSMMAKKEIVVKLQKGRLSYPFITIQLKGQDYAFLIDTAAGTDTLSPTVAKDLGLKLISSKGKIIGAGNTTQNIKYTDVENPLLGGIIRLPSMRFSIIKSIKSAEGLPEGTKIGGILGSHTLKHFKAKIDYGTYSLILPRAAFNVGK